MRAKSIKRKTSETDIAISLNLDGKGICSIKTAIGFFNHMLEAFAGHSGFDLSIEASGDIQTGAHHLVEDIGIALGRLFRSLCADSEAISRYGFFILPMDEAVVVSTIDISGRGGLYLSGYDIEGKIADFDLDLVPEFFRAFALNAEITLHIKIESSGNKHHVAEAIFKSVAHSLQIASRPLSGMVLSTKGMIFNDNETTAQ